MRPDDGNVSANEMQPMSATLEAGIATLFLWVLGTFFVCKAIIWYNFYRAYHTQEFCTRCGQPLSLPHDGKCHNCGAWGAGMPTTSRRVAKLAKDNFEKTGGKTISTNLWTNMKNRMLKPFQPNAKKGIVIENTGRKSVTPRSMIQGVLRWSSRL